MEENNKIVTIVEIDSQQAQIELVKLNATVSNTTKTLEERIDAKNKAVEIQNQLAEKTLKTLKDNIKSLEGVVGKEKEYERAVSKLSSEQLKSVKVQVQSLVQLDKLNQANDKVIAKNAAQESGIRSLRVQLREATQAQGLISQQYGETSIEAIEAAKAVAELKDQIGFNADLIASFNPDQKFKALGAATELAATGTSAVVSGMALFGTTSEDTEKALLKVQSAMAFSQAISSLSDIGDQYRILRTTIVAAYSSMTTARVADTTAIEANIVVENQSTASKIKGAITTGLLSTATTIATGIQWLWNAAIVANPIVALVVALALATTGIYFFVKSLMSSSDANEKASKDTDRLTKALDKESIALYKAGQSIRDKNEHTLAMAKANGASSESIRRLEKKLIDEQIATDKASATTASNTFIQERNSLAKLKAAGASDEVIAAREKEVQAAYDTFQRENKQLDASYKQRAKLVKDQEIQIATEKTEARKKSVENDKKESKDAEQAAKDALEKKKKDAKARIDLEELDITKKKKQDPEVDTLSQEKDLLAKKRDYELSNTELLESEKLVIKEKYSQLESDLITKAEADKTAKSVKQREDQLALDELSLQDKRSHGENVLALELELLEKKTALELENLTLSEKEKAAILEESRVAKEELELQDRQKKAEEQIAFDEQDLEARRIRGENVYGLEKELREKARAQELSDTSLTKEAIATINQKYDNANSTAKQTAIDQDLAAAGEAFGISKEIKMAEMIMAAPTAIGNSFTKASEVYPAPLSLAMGALGAAGVIVPIIKGLADIKKTRFPGKKGGKSSGGGSISSSVSSGSVSKASVSDLAANNAAQLGIDPSLKSNATAQAASNVLGSSGGSVVFSEGKYSDFKNQVQFKEQKTSI